MAGVVAAAIVLAVVLPGSSSKNASPQALALQPVNDPGPAPFTPSTAKSSASPSASASASATGSASASASASGTAGGGPTGTQNVQGSTVGLYGGSEKLSSCDVAQLSSYLTTHADKGKAWAGVEGISQSSIPSYLKSLTPVVLRMDTRVTNHGFSNGAATSFQSVLQSGTAVLIDARGLPLVRCACGNPLLPPVQSNAPKTYTGTTWSSFRSTDVVVVEPSVTEITVVVLYDPSLGSWFGRPVGTHGGGDHKVPPPTSTPTPSTSSSGSSSASPSTSGSGTPTPSGSSSPATPSPSTSAPAPSLSPTEPGTTTEPPAATTAPAAEAPSETSNASASSSESIASLTQSPALESAATGLSTQ